MIIIMATRLTHDDSGSDLITSQFYGSDAWKTGVLSNLPPRDCINLTYVCTLFKERLSKQLNSELKALFIVERLCSDDYGRTTAANCEKHLNNGGFPTRKGKVYSLHITVEIQSVDEISIDEFNDEIHVRNGVAAYSYTHACYDDTMLTNIFRINHATQSVQHAIGLGLLFPVFSHTKSAIKSIYLFWERDYPNKEKKVELCNNKLDELIK
jgi:hypothetical protein